MLNFVLLNVFVIIYLDSGTCDTYCVTRILVNLQVTITLRVSYHIWVSVVCKERSRYIRYCT